MYFANSGGLVQGWDISDLLDGGTKYHQVFRFWTGDDTDGSIVIDDEGFLYVASEYQRFNERSQRLGQLMKLDPSKPDDPIVWSIPATEIGFEGAGGSWSTPALNGDYVYFTTAAGRVMEVDRHSGDIVWELDIGSPAIASPVVVDDVLIQGDCTGALYAWDCLVAAEEAEAAVEDAVRWLRGVDPGGVARLAVRGDPPRSDLRHRRSGRQVVRRRLERAELRLQLVRVPDHQSGRDRQQAEEADDQDQPAVAALPTPSAANPAITPATNPPTCARQSIPSTATARTALITMSVSAERSRAMATARWRRR